MNRIAFIIVFLTLGLPALSRDSEVQKNPFTLHARNATMLFDNATDGRKRHGYLVVDENGKPAVYPPKQPKCLNCLSRTDITALFNAHLVKPDTLNASLVGWNSVTGEWDRYSIDFKISSRDNRCSFFRVNSTEISNHGWIPAQDIPKFWTTVNSGKTSQVPPELLGGVEGPRDTHFCGVFRDN